MRGSIFLLLLMMGGCAIAQTARNVQLYPCHEAGLWGYRNAEGKAVIPTQFPSARRFHEGLAAARKDGRFGYIDSTGAWAIPPQFDGALDFRNGFAKVFRDGKANLVDRHGKLLFDEWYHDVQQGRHPDLFVYYDQELSCGLINREGKKLGPSGFLYISIDASGSSVALLNSGSRVSPGARKLASGAAILDARGRFLLKPQPNEMQSFFGGLASMIDTMAGQYTKTYYDTKGKRRFSEADLPGSFSPNGASFSEGLAAINLKSKSEDIAKSGWLNHAGVVDMDGNLLFSNNKWRMVSQFDSGLAFALDMNSAFWPINRQGKILSQYGYDYVFMTSANFNFDIVQDGLAFALKGKEIIALDSLGVERWRKPLLVNGYSWSCRNGDVVYFYESEGYDLPEYYGFWNVKTGIFSDAEFEDLDFGLGEEPAMVVWQFGHYALIDDAGIEVWLENERRSEVPRPQNLDYRISAIFNFESEVNAIDFDEGLDLEVSETGLKPIKDVKRFPSDAVSIYVADSARPDNQTRQVDWKVGLVNNLPDSLQLDAIYSIPLVFLQAQDSTGAWRNISWLGWEASLGHVKSYKMPPGHVLWSAVPAMAGVFPTQLRLAWALNSQDLEQGKFILSREFPGSINPGQFYGDEGTLGVGFPRLN